MSHEGEIRAITSTVGIHLELLSEPLKRQVTDARDRWQLHHGTGKKADAAREKAKVERTDPPVGLNVATLKVILASLQDWQLSPSLSAQHQKITQMTDTILMEAVASLHPRHATPLEKLPWHF
eukprot:129358-Amphidinium_carterae.1